MDINVEINYAVAPHRVFEMLVDEEFLARKANATGALSHETDISPTDDLVRIRLHRVMPPKVPDYARPLVGDRLDVVQIDEWGPPAADGSRTGFFSVEIKGLPAAIHGTVRLAATSNGGTTQTYTGRVKAGIPFLGRKIEEAAAGAVLAAAAKEQQVGEEWLTGSG